MRFRGFLLFIIIFAFQGCSLAPIVSEKTARTLGSGNWEINTGLSPAYNAWLGRGITENFDLNIAVESQIGTVFSFGGKFSFLQNPEGLSISAMGGFFTGTNSTGYYAGPIVSYKSGWVELYALAKYNNVSWEATSDTADDDVLFDFSLSQSVDFNYWVAVVGANFWFSDGFGLNINGKKFLSSDTSSKGDEIIPSANLLFRF
ncbi:MAG: hypothetical protein CME61_02010 [Halobacteriovoraceae bacterium]|nr:hypothetical protein [Halobacteriovoraceae bacterium]